MPMGGLEPPPRPSLDTLLMLSKSRQRCEIETVTGKYWSIRLVTRFGVFSEQEILIFLKPSNLLKHIMA